MKTGVSPELQHEIEQFLYYESSLLDDGKFDEWLTLLTADLHYFVPVRETLENTELGVRGTNDVALMNDQKESLELRVARLKTGLAHAETPRSRTRHNISNVMIEEQSGTYAVRCNIQVSVSRLEKTEFNFYGYRLDTLRRTEQGLKVSQRKVVLDQTLLPRAISIFF